MSHSVPSESSTVDPAFIVGADLVEFDRRELPIYQAQEAPLSEARWADAGFDGASYGAPLDRLFGEAGDVHVDSIVRDEPHANLAAVGDDPLVVLASLSDGLALPDAGIAHSESLPVFDFGGEHAVAHLHDGGGWSWHAACADWTFDFHV